MELLFVSIFTFKASQLKNNLFKKMKVENKKVCTRKQEYFFCGVEVNA